MKVLGAKIKEFFEDHWPKEYYIETEDAAIQLTDEEGRWLLDADKKYDTAKFGYLVFQGTPKNRCLTPGFPETMSFTTAFNAWAKTDKRAFLVVTVPEDKGDAVAECIFRYLTSQGIVFKLSRST